MWAATPGEREGLAIADMGAGPAGGGDGHARSRDERARRAGGCRGHRARGCPRRARTGAESGGLDPTRSRALLVRGIRRAGCRGRLGLAGRRPPCRDPRDARRRGSGRQHAIVPRIEPGRRAERTDRGLPDAHGRGDARPRAPRKPLSRKPGRSRSSIPSRRPTSSADMAPGPICGWSRPGSATTS